MMCLNSGTSTYDYIDGFSESLLISNEFVCAFYDDAEVMQKLAEIWKMGDNK